MKRLDKWARRIAVAETLPGFEELVRAGKSFVSYEEAQRLITEHGIRSSTQFYAWKKRASLNVPSAPNRTYGKTWKSWPEFLGTDIPSHLKTIVSYKEAQRLARKHNIQTQRQFCAWKERASFNIPSAPNQMYGKTWKSWPDFLSTDTTPLLKTIVSYKEAQRLVRKHGIRTLKEFNAWKERASLKVPSTPNRMYDKAWKSWPEFFGTDTTPRLKTIVSYKEAQRLVKKHGMKSTKQFRAWKKRASLRIPSHPDSKYARQWRGWGSFFSTGLTVGQTLSSLNPKKGGKQCRKQRSKSS